MKWEKWNLLTASEKEEYNYRFKEKVELPLDWLAMYSMALVTFVGILNLLGFAGREDIGFAIFLLFVLYLLCIFYAVYWGRKANQWLDERLLKRSR